jgi:hypothetical protein
LKTQVIIGKEIYALADLLTLRRGLSKQMQGTFMALNDTFAENRMRNMRTTLPAGEKPTHVVRFYDEREKFEQLQRWTNLDDETEQKIEVVNALTNLLPIE